MPRRLAVPLLLACSSFGDAGPIAAGRPCLDTAGCAKGVECYFVAALNEFYCTYRCGTHEDCAGLGFDACCLPTFANAPWVCIPVETGACEGVAATADFGVDGGDDGDGDDP